MSDSVVDGGQRFCQSNQFDRRIYSYANRAGVPRHDARPDRLHQYRRYAADGAGGRSSAAALRLSEQFSAAMLMPVACLPTPLRQSEPEGRRTLSCGR